MKITPVHDTPPPPTVVGYRLDLTPEEFHDLIVVAGIDGDSMRASLKTSTAPHVNSFCQTHDVYGLLQRIRAFAVNGSK